MIDPRQTVSTMILKLLMLEREPLSKKPAYADMHYIQVSERSNPFQDVDSECGPVTRVKVCADASDGRRRFIGTGKRVFEVEV